MAPQVGFEPTTYRLTAGCSTAELLRNNSTILYRLYWLFDFFYYSGMFISCQHHFLLLFSKPSINDGFYNLTHIYIVRQLFILIFLNVLDICRKHSDPC